MSDLFERIDKMLGEVLDGWCTPAKAHLLASAVVINRPKLVVEIGVWAGRSLFPMAMACRENGLGQVIAIDPWSAQASSDGMTGEDYTWWIGADHERIYQEFMANLKRLELEPWIDVRRIKSDDFDFDSLPDPRLGFGILNIDGNHSEQAVRDVERFASQVNKGGIVFCDDIGWNGGAVNKAVEMLLSMGFVKRLDVSTGALFARERKA